MDPVLLDIHTDLPRQGPGSAASTARAWSLVEDLPESPRFLDIGCGPGMQTLDLARLVDGEILAVDLLPAYLDELRRRTCRAGLSNRVIAQQGDMFDLQLPENSFDVVWSEGAIYIIGFERGLVEWRRLLRPGGYTCVTEISWLREDIPQKVRRFWNEEYPAMRDVPTNLAIARRAGYEVVGYFTLPEADWWDDYYLPLEKRLDMLRTRYQGDAGALAAIESTQQEIDLYRDHSDCYGYVFYVLRRVEIPHR